MHLMLSMCIVKLYRASFRLCVGSFVTQCGPWQCYMIESCSRRLHSVFLHKRKDNTLSQVIHSFETIVLSGYASFNSKAILRDGDKMSQIKSVTRLLGDVPNGRAKPCSIWSV